MLNRDSWEVIKCTKRRFLPLNAFNCYGFSDNYRVLTELPHSEYFRILDHLSGGSEIEFLI